MGAWNRRDEPTWHDPNVLMNVCKNMQCSAQANIQAAFSLGQSVFLHLPVVRNFFAHRSDETNRAAKNIAPQYTLSTYLAPAEMILASRPSASVPVIIEWLDEMKITSEFLCK
jgi:hypothetical protein